MNKAITHIKKLIIRLIGMPFRHKIITTATVIAVVCIAVTVVFFARRSGFLGFGGVSGEAEAVMTTKVSTFDGLWNPLRYSDELYYPIGIALLGDNIVVADSMCDRIVIIEGSGDDPQNETVRIGRPGQYGLSYADSGALVDGYRQSSLFMKPSGVAVTPDGNIIIADTGNNAIRKIDDEFVITIAGGSQSGYRNGREGDALFNAPRAVAVDSDGIIYVADTMNHCIRRIDTLGNVTLFAGVPEQPGFNNGSLAEALFHEPSGIALGPDGDIFIADSGNHSIRKISDGAVTTVAGRPGEVDKASGYPAGGYVDGVNARAEFNFPRDVAVLPDGKILVADTMNHSIRVINFDVTRTLVGNGLADQFYLSAENMRLTRPEGICTDGEFIYITDSVNNRIASIPITDRIMAGRLSRDAMLELTGISTDSVYSYNGDIRVFIGREWVDMGRVPPWNTPDHIFMPLRPLFEALGADVHLDDKTHVMTITVDEDETVLTLDRDYFILRGVAVSTVDEIMRLFPYRLEWFPEFSLIAIDIPRDLVDPSVRR